MKNNKWIFLLFFLGLAIVVAPHIAVKINTVKQVGQVKKFEETIAEKEEEEVDEELLKVKSCYESTFYDEEGIHDPFEESNEKLSNFRQCMGIEDDEIFAALEIPKLKLLIPIYLGSSNKILNKGVGQVEGSSLPLGGIGTHTVLSAHRGMPTKAMFKDIDELFEGDVFYIHGSTGTLEYRVAQQRVIYPHETSSLDLEDGRDMATLLTCHPYRYNYQRLLIQGERLEEVQVSEVVEEVEIKEKRESPIGGNKMISFWKNNYRLIALSFVFILLFIAPILLKKNK